MWDVQHGKSASYQPHPQQAEAVNLEVIIVIFGSFPKLGVPFWGVYNKDYRILGSIVGSPDFGKLPFIVMLVTISLTPSSLKLNSARLRLLGGTSSQRLLPLSCIQFEGL